MIRIANEKEERDKRIRKNGDGGGKRRDITTAMERLSLPARRSTTQQTNHMADSRLTVVEKLGKLRTGVKRGLAEAVVQVLLKLLPSLLHNRSVVLSEPDLGREAGGYGEHRFLELPVELHEVVIAPRHRHADGLVPRLLQRECCRLLVGRYE